MGGKSAITALLLAGALASCGEDGAAGGGAQSSALVDLKAAPPYINTLELGGDGSFLMTTNKGMFRIPAGGGEAERLESTVSNEGAQSPVGNFLEVRRAGRDELLGSGHPDDEKSGLPQFLGLLRSNDDGATWSVVSRPGIADLHVMRLAHDRLYAFDAVLGLMLISEDGGRTWQENAAPRGQLMVDFVVDPGEAGHIIGSTEDTLYRSNDFGESWRPVESGTQARLGWPDQTHLYRADADGRFRVSADSGGTWSDVGDVGGEPGDMAVVDAQTIHVALVDGTIRSSSDAGKTWETTFEP